MNPLIATRPIASLKERLLESWPMMFNSPTEVNSEEYPFSTTVNQQVNYRGNYYVVPIR
jgi:hypothetical protein